MSNECLEYLINQISPAILMLLTFARWDSEYVHVTIKVIVKSYYVKFTRLRMGGGSEVTKPLLNCVNFT